jgi:hypothetical protein
MASHDARQRADKETLNDTSHGVQFVATGEGRGDKRHWRVLGSFAVIRGKISQNSVVYRAISCPCVSAITDFSFHAYSGRITDEPAGLIFAHQLKT